MVLEEICREEADGVFSIVELSLSTSTRIE
jgi:hypothetical protein